MTLHPTRDVSHGYGFRLGWAGPWARNGNCALRLMFSGVIKGDRSCRQKPDTVFISFLASALRETAEKQRQISLHSVRDN